MISGLSITVERELNATLTKPCPRCSFYKARFDLTEDILSIPVFAVGRHGFKWDEDHPVEVAIGNGKTRWLVTSGCVHARQLDLGEWRSEAEIKAAWDAIVNDLGGPVSAGTVQLRAGEGLAGTNPIPRNETSGVPASADRVLPVAPVLGNDGSLRVPGATGKCCRCGSILFGAQCLDCDL
jgi:hypothetical protein